MSRWLSYLPVLLVYLSQLGQLQMQPDWLLVHPDQPWQMSLVALAALRSLPWALLVIGLTRDQAEPACLAASLGVALWASGFPQDFAADSWALAWLHGLVLLSWLWRPDWRVMLLAVLFLPWQGSPDGQALLALVAWKLLPKASQGSDPRFAWARLRPLLGLQFLLRMLGVPVPAWEWAALTGWTLTGKRRWGAWLVFGVGLFLWERNVNKSLLIPLQENHLSLSSLVWPADFKVWALRRGRAFGVTPEVQQLIDQIGSRPEPALWTWPRPPLRFQPLLTRAVVERWSGKADLARRPGGGESWVSHNLSQGVCNREVLPVGEAARPAPKAEDARGEVQWRPEKPVGPGSWVEVEVTGAPATLIEDQLSLTLSPGRHRLQLPLDSTEVVVQGVARHRLNLDEALHGLHLAGALAAPGLSSNSLTAVELTLDLQGEQSLWIPYLAAQMSRPDLPGGLRETSPLTSVGRLMQPGQSLKVPCFLEVPEMGAGFECEFYWVAPLRRAYRLGSARFACRPRFPAKEL